MVGLRLQHNIVGVYVGFDAGETGFAHRLEINERIFGREKNALSCTKYEVVAAGIGETCRTCEGNEDNKRVERTVVCAQGLSEVI